MRREINTVVFDLDGTLLDTLDDLCNSVNFALRASGFPERGKSEIRLFLGNGIRNLMLKSVPKNTAESLFEKAFGYFREHYLQHCLDTTRPYPGIMQLLGDLQEKGYKMAIVSNKIDKAVKELNDKFFAKFISSAVGESVNVKRKPCPDTVLKALKELGSSKEESIYVGDSEVDLQTAENAALPCVSVSWGFRDKDYLQKIGAKHLIDKPIDLETAILEIEHAEP